jgi:hypothetical protein
VNIRHRGVLSPVTVLQFEADAPRFQAEEKETDAYDRFINSGQLPSR